MRLPACAVSPGLGCLGEAERRLRATAVRWFERAHLSLNLFCTMAAQVSVDYDTFLKDRLVTADERPQWVS